jgi:hypothetical protein
MVGVLVSVVEVRERTAVVTAVIATIITAVIAAVGRLGGGRCELVDGFVRHRLVPLGVRGWLVE